MKLSSLIGHVVELFDDVNATSKPADRCIDQFFRSRKYLGSKDRRFIAESLYGILRHMKKLTWTVTASGSNVSGILLCAAYLMLVRNSTPEELSAETNIPVEQLQAIEQLVRTDPPGSSETESLSLRYSFPEWMIGEWIESYGLQETEALCSVLNSQAPMTIRVNTIKTTREECRSALQQEGIETEIAVHSPFGLHLKRRTNLFQLKAFKDGLFEVQDEGSQLLALLTDPKPKDKVIDACAGAGGKALALAAVMKNRGEIFALDVHSFRLDELRKRIKRSGVDSIRTRAIQENEYISTLEQSADVVLVDAPCTGTGTIRRNPGMKWSVSPTMVDELQQKQFSILSLNARYVKPGGRLIYATCSLMKQENENVVSRFLDEQKHFVRTDPKQILDRYGLAHLGNNGYVQLMPHKTDTDGFFAVVMKRTS